MSVYNELRLSQQLFDAVIRVDNVEFPVHKIKLCECSEFFRGLFTRWSTTDERDFDVSMVTADIMKLIIDFAYTGSVSVTNENVEDLFKATDMLLVNGIVEACCSFMEEHLTPQNCIGIWLITGFYHTPEMNRKVFSFIMKHFEEVAATSEEFLLLSVDDLVRIIEKDQLNVRQEKMVFAAVLRWITHATDKRREYIHQLLSNVRLAFMSPEYLKDTLSNNELVRTSEGCQQLISMTLETMLHPGTQRSSDLFHPRLFPAILFAVGGWNWKSPTIGIEAYDVHADRWVTITDKDESPRIDSGTVFHNGSLYCVGGYNFRRSINSLQRFDLSTKTWHDLSPMHYKRRCPGVTVLDGYIYAVGGDNYGEYLSTAERYDPSTNQWTLIAPMNEERTNTSCTILNGKVYICGGFNRTIYYLSSAECYDPATNQWTLIANMGSGCCYPGVIAYAGRVFAVGGWRNRSLNTAEAYDPDTNTWNNVPSMLEGCYDFGIGVIDDRLFVVGGDNGSSTLITTVQCFDISTGQWSKVCSMNIARRNFSCCVVSGLPNLADYVAPRRSSQVEVTHRYTEEEAKLSVYNELRLNQQLFDAMIRVDNVEFHMHKNVLCNSSSFFRAPMAG